MARNDSSALPPRVARKIEDRQAAARDAALLAPAVETLLGGR
jgi:hypothetical protein